MSAKFNGPGFCVIVIWQVPNNDYLRWCKRHLKVIHDMLSLLLKIYNVCFQDFAEAFIKKILRIGKDFAEIHVIFDRYIQNSLKSRTRHHRTSGKEVRYRVKNETSIANTSLKQFLSHADTKQDLTIFLSHKVVERFISLGINFVVTFDTKSLTNIDDLEMNLNVHDHEEADTLIVLHTVEIAKRIPFCECVIFSPDTDVLLLLINFYRSLPIVTKFWTGRGDNLRHIDIGRCYEALGPQRASAMLGFHTFTGCDQTGKFNGKSKSACWKVLMRSKGDIYHAFSALGKDEALPTQEVIESLEQFVVTLFGGNGCPTYVKTLPQLRWYLYSKFQTDADKLPPTMSALKFKIFRSHFVTLVLRRANIPVQNLPQPEKYGWERRGNALMPIMTDNLPAPMAMIELSVCGCKSNCQNKRCKCRKNCLPCTDMCKCIDCANTGEDEGCSENKNEFDTESDDDYD